jgi:hypothetical protein
MTNKKISIDINEIDNELKKIKKEESCQKQNELLEELIFLIRDKKKSNKNKKYNV